MNLFRSKNSSSTNRKFNQCTLVLIPLVLAYFALLPKVQAVSPAPDGGYANGNTAEGANALFHLTSGVWNTALGDEALFSNNGNLNTAEGLKALFANTTGNSNTANGVFALSANTIGSGNTASGQGALLHNIVGSFNTAYGFDALLHNTGSHNIAVGSQAGAAVTGDGNIDIGNAGVAGESNVTRIGFAQMHTFIAGIFGGILSLGDPVIIAPDGQLGTVISSRRFKDEIKPMDNASEAILALKPVTFHYKKELDPKKIPQFGLVAEDVEKVNPDLVTRDAKGEVHSVRYDAVNAMLLNEFLKEHKAFVEEQRKVQQQEKTIAELKSGMEALTVTVKEQASQIQKVSAQLELSKAAPQTVVNNQ
jgi:hypothetical protein